MVSHGDPTAVPTIWEIPDDVWAACEPRLPPQKPAGTPGRPIVPFRRVVDGRHYVLGQASRGRPCRPALAPVRPATDASGSGWRTGSGSACGRRSGKATTRRTGSERTNRWHTRVRTLRIRDEKKPATDLALVQFAGALIVYRLRRVLGWVL